MKAYHILRFLTLPFIIAASFLVGMLLSFSGIVVLLLSIFELFGVDVDIYVFRGKDPWYEKLLSTIIVLFAFILCPFYSAKCWMKEGKFEVIF